MISRFDDRISLGFVCSRSLLSCFKFVIGSQIFGYAGWVIAEGVEHGGDNLIHEIMDGEVIPAVF